MTNTHAERVTMGMHDRVPLPVWICLIFVMALGMITMGYQASLVGSARTRAMVPLIIAFCIILCVAIDLDRPQQGILRVDQSPMLRLADALENHSER
jgi:purine-cytosine permease-like protein